MRVAEKLEKLRELMKERGLSAYIIPSSDAHQSEYVAEYFKSRQWISGFTGSAGTVVVTEDDAGLWTDGRYYIQAARQLQDSGIRLFKAAEMNVPSYGQWLEDLLPQGSAVGFDGKVVDVKNARELENRFGSKNIVIQHDEDLVGLIWKDRPILPDDQIFIHEIEFAGKSRCEKLKDVRDEMTRLNISAFLLSSLDDIAWLLNIRGADVPNNPVAIAHVLVTEQKCCMFIDEMKVSQVTKTELENDGVLVLPYEAVTEHLSTLTKKDKVLLDPSKVSISLYKAISADVPKLEDINITTRMKAVKNDIELERIRECMINDGIALTRTIKWLKEHAGREAFNEVDVDRKLLEYRTQQPYFMGPSFDSIIGYKENAAMMHYKALPETAKEIGDEGFLLIDSGGQYHNGTTDTTRTIALGKLTDEEKFDFTLVLKGNIGIASAIFLYGVSGHYLEVLARQPLWQHGIDYKCGTGHGIGFFLNVHEGPQRFAIAHNDVKLEKNMVITNEPGVYKEGRHGIRTENVLVVKEAGNTEFGQFMAFEDLTLCPIDLDGIIPEMLNDNERSWLNSYHKKVFDLLSPRLTEEEREWLRKQTREI